MSGRKSCAPGGLAEIRDRNRTQQKRKKEEHPRYSTARGRVARTGESQEEGEEKGIIGRGGDEEEREKLRERERRVLGVYLVPVDDWGGAGTGGHRAVTGGRMYSK